MERSDRDEPKRVAVSACLLGVACRYDGGSKRSAAVTRWLQSLRPGVDVVAVCPEELGGLGTPRPAAELRGGDGAAVLKGQATVARVRDDADVTEPFVTGAERAAERVKGAARAVLKSRSPSCGVATVHLDGAVRDGDGVFAALLKRLGVDVVSDEALP